MASYIVDGRARSEVLGHNFRDKTASLLAIMGLGLPVIPGGLDPNRGKVDCKPGPVNNVMSRRKFRRKMREASA